MIQQPTVDSTAVWIAALGFFGLIVTSLFTYVGQRAAAKDARDAAKDAAVAAREARDTAKEAKATNDKIEVLVNNKSDVQATLIKEAKDEIAKLNAQLLAKAEASPASGATGSAPTTSIPVKVVVVDTEKPIDVIDKTPTKSGDK